MYRLEKYHGMLWKQNSKHGPGTVQLRAKRIAVPKPCVDNEDPRSESPSTHDVFLLSTGQVTGWGDHT